MNQIQLLPEHIIDQIKAGEVIERPASLVKELLENSIDANSTKISLHIAANGLDLISVEDNGDGISFQDLPYAFCRHATSKIKSFDDLYSLTSYGFRGEALASISSISKITCSSNTKNNDGGKIIIHGAQELSHTKFSNSQKGTSIFITDLFYNTPARLKFIKSQTSEKNALVKTINAFLLATPHIHWTIQWDNKEKQIFPIAESSLKRIEQIFKKRSSKERSTIHHIEEEYDGYNISAFIDDTSSLGNSGKKHFILINNRLIFDHNLHRTILRSLEPFWGNGFTGNYLVKINTPSNDLDVNVHPGKTTVKFLKPSIIFSMTSSALKKLKRVNDPTPSQSLLIQNRFDEKIKELKTTFVPQSQAPIDQLLHGSSQISRLVSDFYILRFDNQLPLLTKGSDLLLFFIKEHTQRSLSDSEITPLIVSEPIFLETTQLDCNFAKFKEMGFEIDRLDHSTVVLRSIPTSLAPFSQIITTAFSNINLVTNFPDLKPLFSQAFLSLSQINIICEKIPIRTLVSNNILKSLDQNTLNKIYYEK